MPGAKGEGMVQVSVEPVIAVVAPGGVIPKFSKLMLVGRISVTTTLEAEFPVTVTATV